MLTIFFTCSAFHGIQITSCKAYKTVLLKLWSAVRDRPRMSGRRAADWNHNFLFFYRTVREYRTGLQLLCCNELAVFMQHKNWSGR